MLCFNLENRKRMFNTKHNILYAIDFSNKTGSVTLKKVYFAKNVYRTGNAKEAIVTHFWQLLHIKKNPTFQY